ncbi:MAG: CU044_2847 family protein [Spirulinaceae cyanobacterium]
MSESSQIQKLTYTDDNGEEYEIFIETKSVDFLKDDEGDGRPGRGGNSRTVEMKKAAKMIRGYTAYVVSAFRNFSAANVEEVKISFSLKVGGKAGIPYITEGSAESNVAIEVKCTFPDND